MGDIFDKLGYLLKSMLNDGVDAKTGGFAGDDGDLKQAWSELEDYLNSEEAAPAAEKQRKHEPVQSVPMRIRMDFSNLEIKPGVPFGEVKRAYKRLLIRYHPDRHAGNSQKLRTATEIVQKINDSFQRLKKYYETGSK